jgi:glycosyltransferase involved in cell wall biosynthesis
MGAAECVAAIAHLPRETTFVFQAVGDIDPVVAELAHLVEDRAPARFRLEALPYEETDDIFRACDIGAVLYRGAGPNYEVCGKASGKLCRFLRAGRPVIVDRRGGLEWVAEYGAGVIAETPEEVGRAVERIRADESAYRARARACFEEHLRFEPAWDRVRAALGDVMR